MHSITKYKNRGGVGGGGGWEWATTLSIYLIKKLCRAKREKWKYGTGKLDTWFCLSIFNMFSLRRTFQSMLLHLLLLKRARCIRIEARVFTSQKFNASYHS